MSTIPAVNRSDVLLRSVSLSIIILPFFCLLLSCRVLYTLDFSQAIVPGYCIRSFVSFVSIPAAMLLS